MSDSPKVSVLLTCFNREGTIGEALHSVIEQDFADREIILVDDGSTDGSVAVAESFPEVRILRNEANRGVVYTRQRALEAARGEYLLFVDSDNRLKPKAVTKLVEAMEGEPEEVAFIYGQREYFGDGSGFSRFPEFDVEILKKKNYVEMTSLFRCGPVQEIGFTEGHEPEDYDLVLGLVKKGYRGVLLNEPVLDYRLHDQTISASFDPLHKLRLKENLARKHSELFTADDRRKLRRDSRRKLLGIFIRSPKSYSGRSAMLRDYGQMVRFFGLSREVFRFIPVALGRWVRGTGVTKEVGGGAS